MTVYGKKVAERLSQRRVRRRLGVKVCKDKSFEDFDRGLRGQDTQEKKFGRRGTGDQADALVVRAECFQQNLCHRADTRVCDGLCIICGRIWVWDRRRKELRMCDYHITQYLDDDFLERVVTLHEAMEEEIKIVVGEILFRVNVAYASLTVLYLPC